jgi:hypothetical protein
MTAIEFATTIEHRCEALTISDIPPYRCTTSATADRRGRDRFHRQSIFKPGKPQCANACGFFNGALRPKENDPGAPINAEAAPMFVPSGVCGTLNQITYLAFVPIAR